MIKRVRKSSPYKTAKLVTEKAGLVCFSFAILGLCVVHMATYPYRPKKPTNML